MNIFDTESNIYPTLYSVYIQVIFAGTLSSSSSSLSTATASFSSTSTSTSNVLIDYIIKIWPQCFFFCCILGLSTIFTDWIYSAVSSLNWIVVPSGLVNEYQCALNTPELDVLMVGEIGREREREREKWRKITHEKKIDNIEKWTRPRHQRILACFSNWVPFFPLDRMKMERQPFVDIIKKKSFIFSSYFIFIC